MRSGKKNYNLKKVSVRKTDKRLDVPQRFAADVLFKVRGGGRVGVTLVQGYRVTRNVEQREGKLSRRSCRLQHGNKEGARNRPKHLRSSGPAPAA